MCVFQFWTIDTEEDYPILQTSKMVNKKRNFAIIFMTTTLMTEY